MVVYDNLRKGILSPRLSAHFMETNVYFEEIHQHIIGELKQAETDITIAVAWFTDTDIFKVLCRKAAEGVPVKLLLLDDAINRVKSRLPHQQLTGSGGELFWVPETESGNIMHHKFCVIDYNVVITGSYNWSRRARENNEDIVVVSGAGDFALQYLETFNQILKLNGHPVKSIPKVDQESIVRRLELIRNLISLRDFEDIPGQIRKFRTASCNDELLAIIELLEEQHFPQADQRIIDYVARFRAIVPYSDPEITTLKQELLAMEYQVTALSDQKAETERLISEFLHQHHETLGGLIKRYLEIKAVLAEKRVQEVLEDDEASPEDVEEAQDEHQEAEEDYEDYSDQYQSLEDEPAPAALDPEEQGELKALYRKASMRCHPDRVAEEKKAGAEEVFKRLTKAYKENDIEGVRQILDELKTGKSMGDRAASLAEIEQLRKAVEDLRIKVQQLREELAELRGSDIGQQIEAAGDWVSYFSDKKIQLEKEIADLELQLTEDDE